jgi:hypothetical protein
VPEVSASSPSGRWTRRNPRRRASRRSPGLPGASRGPLGASVNSAIDVKGEIAAIELADVSGPQRSPGFGSTPGGHQLRCGQLKRAALELNCCRIVLAVGVGFGAMAFLGATPRSGHRPYA